MFSVRMLRCYWMGEVLLWYLRPDWWYNVYHFVTCNPPTLLLGFSLAMTSSCSRNVGLLTAELFISLRTGCDWVTRWLSPFLIVYLILLIVTGFLDWAELPSSALICVSWLVGLSIVGLAQLWLKWSLDFLVIISARWFYRCCSLTHLWPYNRFSQFQYFSCLDCQAQCHFVCIFLGRIAKLSSDYPSWVRF